MKYRILIKYMTGNSFHSEYREENLEISFESLEIAKENLKIIKQHYQEIYLAFENGFLNLMINKNCVKNTVKNLGFSLKNILLILTIVVVMNQKLLNSFLILMLHKII